MNESFSLCEAFSLTRCVSTWFERVSMMVILLNCVTLGMYQPCENIDCSSDRCQVLQVHTNINTIDTEPAATSHEVSKDLYLWFTVMPCECAVLFLWNGIHAVIVITGFPACMKAVPSLKRAQKDSNKNLLDYKFTT